MKNKFRGEKTQNNRIKAKLEKAENSGFTDYSQKDILAQSKKLFNS